MSVMHPRLFVNIAAYRDRDCVNTIADLFSKARWPERIFIGVCWQSLSPDDDDCDPVGAHADQCRVLRFDVSEAEGACWARHKVQSLWRGEEFVLQIDSHTRFVEHWDKKLLGMLAACPSPRPILSNYPAAFTPPHQIDSHIVSRIHAAGFDSDGMLKLGSEGLDPADVPDIPQPTAFCGAGFVFGPSAWIKDVPYDPFLYFQGEEITLAVRLYTHGWDIFSPSDVLAYHDYNSRPDRPKHWADRRDWTSLNQRSMRRIRHLLGMGQSDDAEVLRDIGRYGLGSARTLAKYQALTGINFKERTIGGKTTAQLEAEAPPEQKRRRTAEVFTGLWRNNGWGDPETRSGSGSTLAATETLRAHLIQLCQFLGVRQLVDLGCGDVNWMSRISQSFDLYLGLDVVPDLIAANERAFGGRCGHFFALRDGSLDPLPKADAILCRDVMTHLSNDQVLAVLRKISASGAKYLLATTETTEVNRDIPVGDWRLVDLTKAPFDLAPPFLQIDERQDGSKMLGVWRIGDIALRAAEEPQSVEDFGAFDAIFRSNGWGSDESVSGPGSTADATAQLRAALPEIFRRLNITSVLDAGCGDLNWMRQLDYVFERYIGIDVVEPLIARHRLASWPAGYEFRQASLTDYAGPALDAVFSRDVLVHLPFALVQKAIAHWVSLGFRALFLTSFPRTTINRDCAIGAWRPLNLELPPFNFPRPKIEIWEGAVLEGTPFADKSVCVWEASALVQAIAEW
jgi:hypothetical protein